MIIANATGCTSIWGGNPALIPYTASQKDGKGPAWANSLFEDNAEYGLGIHYGVKRRRVNMHENFQNALKHSEMSQELRDLFEQWVACWNNLDESNAIADKIIPILKEHPKNDR